MIRALAQANKPNQWTGGNQAGWIESGAAAGGATYTVSNTTPATYMTASAVK